MWQLLNIYYCLLKEQVVLCGNNLHKNQSFQVKTKWISFLAVYIAFDFVS